MATWGQPGLHHKPIATVDVMGYWKNLHELLRKAADCGLMRPENLQLIPNVGSVAEVLPALASYSAPYVGKWTDLERTRSPAGISSSGLPLRGRGNWQRPAS